MVLVETAGPEGEGTLSFGAARRSGGNQKADVLSRGGAGMVNPIPPPSWLASQVMTTRSLSRCPLSPTVENRQLTLDLQTENKGSVVSGGELTIFLDGPAVDLGSLPNGSAGTEGECRPAPCLAGRAAGLGAQPWHLCAGSPLLVATSSSR